MVLSQRCLLVCLLVGGVACTEGVLPGDAYQQPLEINSRLIDPLPEGSHPLASVIWTDPLQRQADLMMPPRWIDSTVTSAVTMGTDGDLYFALQIFRPPPQEAVVEIAAPTGEIALAAMGEIVIVGDTNGDGTFAIGPNATIVGADDATSDVYLAGTSMLLFYVARPFSTPVEDANQLGPFDKPGYQLVSYDCAGRLLLSYRIVTDALFDVQPSRVLIERRSCLRTHSP